MVHFSTGLDIGVRADPFFGDESGDALELVADVLDGAPGGWIAEVLARVGTAEREADGDAILRGEDVLDGGVEVGDAALDQLEAFSPVACGEATSGSSLANHPSDRLATQVTLTPRKVRVDAREDEFYVAPWSSLSWRQES